MMHAIQLYRSTFKPSAYLDKPYVMLGFNVFAADTDDEARYLATSWQQSFVNLRSGRPSRLPPPVHNCLDQLGPGAQDLLDHVLSCSAIGAPGTVAGQLKAFINKTGADELMITSNMFDHAARLRSYEITAQVRSEEHTSELQSLMRISYAVFCLKKKNTKHTQNTLES